MAQNFRTELGKARNRGSAKSGTHHFWMQRLTALANIPLFIIFIILIVALVGKDYATVRATIANPFIAVLVGLMIFSGIYHMKLGMQIILEDYIPNEMIRIVFLALNIFFCFVVGGALILALLKICLGG